MFFSFPAHPKPKKFVATAFSVFLLLIHAWLVFELERHHGLCVQDEASNAPALPVSDDLTTAGSWSERVQAMEMAVVIPVSIHDYKRVHKVWTSWNKAHPCLHHPTQTHLEGSKVAGGTQKTRSTSTTATTSPNMRIHTSLIIFFAGTDAETREAETWFKTILGSFDRVSASHSNTSSSTTTTITHSSAQLEDATSSSTSWSRCFTSSRPKLYTLPLASTENTYDKARTDENWVRGPNRMFYDFMRGKELGRRFDVVFWMETDTVPLRDGWLDAVWRKAGAMMMGGDWWIVGSAFRGDCVLSEDLKHCYLLGDLSPHINGNALYHTSSPSFQKHLHRTLTGKWKLWPFDLAIYLEWSRSSDETLKRKALSLYIYTDFIQNYGNFPVYLTKLKEAHPEMYLVHVQQGKMTVEEYRRKKMKPEVLPQDPALSSSGTSQSPLFDLISFQPCKGDSSSVSSPMLLDDDDSGETEGEGTDKKPRDTLLESRIASVSNAHNQLMLTFVSKPYIMQFANFWVAVEKVGISSNVLVAAMDTGTAAYLEERGIVYYPYFPSEENGDNNQDGPAGGVLPRRSSSEEKEGEGTGKGGEKGEEDDGEGTSDNYFSAGFKNGVNRRYELLSRILSLGVNVLMTDLDCIWLQNPFPLFPHSKLKNPQPKKALGLAAITKQDTESSLASSSSYDLYIQSDARDGFTERTYSETFPNFVNGGLHYSLGTRKMSRFFKAIARELSPSNRKSSSSSTTDNNDNNGEWDQTLLNRLLRTNPFGVRYRILDPLLYPNGFVYFVSRLPRLYGVMPLVVHANWITSSEHKRYRLREAGLWYIDPPEYYSVGANSTSSETKPPKYLAYEEPPLHNGLNNQRNALRSAMAIAKALGRILILPAFHAVHLGPEEVDLDFFFDFGKFHDAVAEESGEGGVGGAGRPQSQTPVFGFPSYREHSFLDRVFPNAKTDPRVLKVHIDISYDDKPAGFDSWPNAVTFRAKKRALGAAEWEIKSWLGSEETKGVGSAASAAAAKERKEYSEAPLILLTRAFRRFDRFDDPVVELEWRKVVSRGLVPNPAISGIANHIVETIRGDLSSSSSFSSSSSPAEYNCLHLRRGDFASQQNEPAVLSIARSAANFFNIDEPLYVTSDESDNPEVMDAIRSVFTGKVVTIWDYFPDWERVYVERPYPSSSSSQGKSQSQSQDRLAVRNKDAREGEYLKIF
ncbi:hypothetical protein HK102_004281 [Quaeritorhiza haematococci]|nr:hypothetical protein HK102_004281 [Quaeritorhiza haematococci]